jgi:hypothetical protein
MYFPIWFCILPVWSSLSLCIDGVLNIADVGQDSEDPTPLT